MKNLHKNAAWRSRIVTAQPGQLSFLEDVPDVAVDTTAYIGPYHLCTTCNVRKPMDDFHKDVKSKFGVSHRCKDCNLARHRIYSRVKTIKMRVNTTNHRARLLSIPGTLYESDITALLAQSPTCAYCGIDYAAFGVTWHIDHVRPLGDYKKGDLLAVNDLANVEITCAFCNGAKRDYTLDQFKAWLRAVQSGNAIREMKAPYAA